MPTIRVTFFRRITDPTSSLLWWSNFCTKLHFANFWQLVVFDATNCTIPFETIRIKRSSWCSSSQKLSFLEAYVEIIRESSLYINWKKVESSKSFPAASNPSITATRISTVVEYRPTSTLQFWCFVPFLLLIWALLEWLWLKLLVATEFLWRLPVATRLNEESPSIATSIFSFITLNYWCTQEILKMRCHIYFLPLVLFFILFYSEDIHFVVFNFLLFIFLD